MVQRVPLQWRNGDERPWKEIVDDQERAGWVVDLDTLLERGWSIAYDGRRLGRDKDGRIFMLHSPEGDFGDYLTEILGSDEVLDQVSELVWETYRMAERRAGFSADGG